MKKFITISCLCLLLFIAVSLFVSSRAMAFDPKKDLVSSMNLKATGPMSKNALSELRTSKEDRSSGDASVPIRDGLSTYLDCGQPVRRDLGTQVITSDYRTVIGLHFILK